MIVSVLKSQIKNNKSKAYSIKFKINKNIFPPACEIYDKLRIKMIAANESKKNDKIRNNSKHHKKRVNSSRKAQKELQSRFKKETMLKTAVRERGINVLRIQKATR